MTDDQLFAIEQRKLDHDEFRLATEQAAIEIVDISAARSQAIKWTFTIASISTALGVLGLISVPDNLPDLTTGWKWALTVVMAGAVVSAAMSIAFAGTGAGETPNTNGENLTAKLAGTRSNLKSALKWSQVAAVAAFIFVGLGIGIVYLASTEPQRYFLAQDDATVICGTLSINSTTGAIELKPETDPAIAAVPVPDATKLEAKTRCE